MTKKEFIENLKRVYKDPIKELEIKDGKCNVSKLNDLFKGVSEIYLDSSVKGIVDKTPEISFESLDGKDTKVKNPTGKYDEDKNKIIMNSDRISKAKSVDEIRTAILEVLAIVCHEYQHFKQSVFARAAANGDKEKMEAMKKQIGYNPDMVIDDAEHGRSTSRQIGFMREVMPEQRERVMAKTKSDSRASGDPVWDAFYYRRPVEVDARETSLPVFGEIANDVLKSGSLGMGFKMKMVQYNQKKKNDKDMRRQGPGVMKAFEEEMKTIKPEHFIKYGEIIEKESQTADMTEEMKEKIEERKAVFADTLAATVQRLGPEKSQEFLNELLEKAPEGSFAHEAAKQKLAELAAPTTSKVSRQELEGVRGDEKEEKVVVERARETAQELTLEEEQELAAQMVKRIDD